MALEVVSNSQAGSVLAFDAESQSLEAATHGESQARVNHSPKHRLAFAQGNRDPALTNDRSGHQVIVSGQIFGGAMNNHIDAVVQRSGIEGRRKGAINDRTQAVSPGDGGQALQTEAAEKGIGGEFR